MTTQTAEYVLVRDITAADLAMDSPDPNEGYQPSEVIGPKGTKVVRLDEDDLEVTGFANDPYAAGFVNTKDVVRACPSCGQPMSLWDDADKGPVRWYCDGPNDNTVEKGCFTEATLLEGEHA